MLDCIKLIVDQKISTGTPPPIVTEHQLSNPWKYRPNWSIRSKDIKHFLQHRQAHKRISTVPYTGTCENFYALKFLPVHSLRDLASLAHSFFVHDKYFRLTFCLNSLYTIWGNFGWTFFLKKLISNKSIGYVNPITNPVDWGLKICITNKTSTFVLMS